VGRVLAGLLACAAFAGAILGAAGRLDWGRGWAYLALLLGVQGAAALHVRRRDPELIRRRGRVGEGTPAWDLVLLAAFGLAYVATVGVAALDAGRFGCSSVPAWAWPCGACLLVVGTGLFVGAMVVNTHFEKTVRIQRDRGHRVVDRGPYRVVRHPGYVGASLGYPLAAPLLLGSWWAFLPALLCVATLVVRTALEDRLLRRELAGYAAYAARVRYRLIPGLW
jgi:protein-S-isoprenylcysteine O-methyltransferase Ste14